MKKLCLAIVFILLATGISFARSEVQGLLLLDDVLRAKKISRSDIFFKHHDRGDILNPIHESWVRDRDIQEVWVSERPLYRYAKRLGKNIQVLIDTRTWIPKPRPAETKDIVVLPDMKEKIKKTSHPFYSYERK